MLKKPPIRVVVADDHPIMREGVAALLEQRDNIDVVGTASDGREAVKLVNELRPDVVSLDILMPKLNGVDASRRMLADHKSLKIVCLTMLANQEYVQQMFSAGACGYLLKQDPAQELVSAIYAVVSGEEYVSASLKPAKDAFGDDEEETRKGERRRQITSREREVLQLIAEGHNTKEIADQLGISSKTVLVHRENLMRKLNANSTVALARHAFREGIAQV